MSATGIGASVRRKEDLRFITGKGHYTDDISRPGQTHAYFLRSPHAHARIARRRIVGVALSPEYIYQIREGDLLPDDRRFGVFWMGHRELAAAFDMQGAFNDVYLTLGPGASEPEVIGRLDRLLAPYGGLGAFGRDDQPSHKFVSNELKELRGMAVVVPTIFLVVAAFLLHVVVSRLVSTQREQIAVLVRLALAGLLLDREGEAPCLVLDDALVYADEHRFEVMKTILQQAAAQVQIVILTCRPRDYRGLSGRFLRLEDCGG